MSANLAHFFIAESALERYSFLTNKGKGKEGLAKLLNSYLPFFILGSVGPDLPSYPIKSILEKAIQADVGWRPVVHDGWPYAFHHIRVNEMPAALFNIVLKDSQKSPMDARHQSRFAFATGWLCHMATDRAIHPIVNAYAGNFYNSIDNTIKHMHCEVIQDLWIFAQYKGNDSIKDFYKFKPEKMIDLKKGKGKNGIRPNFDVEEIDAFAKYIARAAFEAYSMKISDEETKDWLTGIKLAISKMDNIGPVKKQADVYKDLVGEKLYKGLSECADKEFIKAVKEAEAACFKMIEFAGSLLGGEPLAGESRRVFLDFVGDYDLTNPPMK